MTVPTPTWPTKVATLALPSRETHVAAVVWPSAAGSLLFLAELNLALPIRHEFTSELTTALSNAWQKIVSEPTRDPEQTLEGLLLELNPLLQARERIWGNPLAPRYHLALALVKGAQLALATVGHMGAYVVSVDRLTNVMAAAHGGGATARPKATFTQLVGGELSQSEVLLLATSALFDFISPEKLRQLVGGRAPGQGLRELEQVVASLPHHPPLGAIALSLLSAAAAEGTQPSMERLQKTKYDTNSLLTPTLSSSLRRWFQFGNDKTTPTETPELTQITPVATRTRWWQLPTVWYRRLHGLVLKLSWLKSRSSVKTTVAWWIEARLSSIRQLPRTKKITLVLSAILLVAFSQNMVSAGRVRLAAQGSERYNELVAQLTEHQAAIEGALIYHDDARARELFASAEQLLLQLPRTSGSRHQQYRALEQGLATIRARLDRLAEIRAPQPWATLPGEANWRGLTTNATSLYAWRDTGQIVQLTPEGKTGKSINLPTALGTPVASYTEGANLLFRGVGGQLASYDTRSLTVAAITNPPQLADAAWYDGRLYYLGQSPRFIFRTNRTGTNLASPTLWLKASQGELKDAVSITVDGTIYVATAAGVEKYVLGLKRDFLLQPPNPPLRNLELIRTTSEGDYLYLVAPKDKRVLIYDKQGKLIVQLTFPELTELSSIAIDGQNKYLYVLSGTAIYRLNILSYVQ